MPLDGSAADPFGSWNSMLRHLKHNGMEFRGLLEELNAEHSPLHSARLPAAEKASILRFLLCDVAPRKVSPSANEVCTPAFTSRATD